MEAYSYQKEIRRSLIHFINAMDGAVIKRFDKKGVVKQIIKPSYQFANKGLPFKDLITASDQTILPIVAITLNGLRRNNDRVFNKNQEYRIENRKYKKSETAFLPHPTPVDLDINVKFIASYYEDLLQMINNFIPYTNPYIQISMKEPWSGNEIISTIVWDGGVNIISPEDYNIGDKIPRHIAEANFKFETWIFKEKENIIKNICFIEQDYYLEKQWRDYSELIKDTPEIVTVTGKPKIKYVQPFTVALGKSENFTIILDDSENIEGVFLSGGNSSIFPNSSSFDLFPGELAPIEAISVPFLKLDSNLIFEIPRPNATGFFDIILSNSCTYVKMIGSNGFWTTSSNDCDSTTFFTRYSSCCSTYMDNVFLSGIRVVPTFNTDCTLSPCNSSYTPPINIC